VLASEAINPNEAVVLVDKGGPGSLNPQPGIDQFAVASAPDARFGSMDMDDLSVNASGGLTSAGYPKADIVDIIEYSPNRIRLAVNAPCEGYIVLCDAYYPCWKAAINGRETGILRANCAMRAVGVPAGQSIIEFFYDTSFFLKSLLISFSAAIFCIGMALFDALRRKRKKLC
jgi:hypothetical protein